MSDILLGTLTVRETIAYSLRLHLRAASSAFIRQRVEYVINALGLQACQDQIIGTPIRRGISGGQKRRVSVGSCMVCFPYVSVHPPIKTVADRTSARCRRVLLMDEPTSGVRVSIV